MFPLFGFIAHVALFASIQILGIFTGLNAMDILDESSVVVQEVPLSMTLFSFIIAFSILFLLLRFSGKFNFFKYFFYFLIIIGSKLVFEAFFVPFLANILTLSLLALFLLRKSLLVHNLTLGITIAGVAVSLGLSFSFSTVLFLLGAFSFYDVLAVYRSSHMVKLFKGMANKGVILAIMIPQRLNKLKVKSNNFTPGQGVFILGTGDLAFPLFFAVSALKFSVISAWFIVAGATVGAALVYYLLTTQKSTRAMPALPPIALCSVVGFALSLIV
jgi:presenilin-like A22 family membrane protease